MLTFAPKREIIRLGGRCKDKELEECLMPRLKNDFRFDYDDFNNLKDNL